MGKPQTVRNCLRVRVSVDSLGNEDSKLVTYPNPGQVHSRVEAEDADRGRITRPEDDRRSLSCFFFFFFFFIIPFIVSMLSSLVDIMGTIYYTGQDYSLSFPP